MTRAASQDGSSNGGTGLPRLAATSAYVPRIVTGPGAKAGSPQMTTRRSSAEGVEDLLDAVESTRFDSGVGFRWAVECDIFRSQVVEVLEQ